MSTPENKKINGRKVFRVLDLFIRTASLLMLAPFGLLVGVVLFINTHNGIDSTTDIILVGKMLLVFIVAFSCIYPPLLLEKIFRKKIISEILGRVPAYVFPVYFYLDILPIISAHATAA